MLPWLEQSTGHLLCHTHWKSALCNLLLTAWAFDGWTTDFTRCFHRTVLCVSGAPGRGWSPSGRFTFHIPAVGQDKTPKCSDTAPSTQEMQQFSISELQILLECGMGRWLRCPQGWVGVYSPQTLRQLPPAPMTIFMYIWSLRCCERCW